MNTRRLDSTSTFPTYSTVISNLNDTAKFIGDPIPLSLLPNLVPTKDQQEAKPAEQLAADKGAAYAVLGPWLGNNNSPAEKFPLIKDFVASLRADPAHKSIGAVGFCWGGWAAVQLTHAASGPLVDASVSCHPASLAIPEDIENVEKPLSIHIGDSDDFIPLSECEKIQEVFKHKPNCSINVYKDQVHGFAARGDLTVEKDRKAKEEVAEKVTRSMTLPDYLDHRIF